MQVGASLVASVLAVAVGSPASTGNDPDLLELAWEAPPECPDRETVRRLVRDIVRDRTHGHDRPLSVSGRIVTTPPGYSLDLRVNAPDGAMVRQVRAARCDTLGEVTVTLVAIALDPTTEARLIAEPESAPTEDDPGLVPPGPDDVPVPAAPVADTRPPRPAAGLDRRRRVPKPWATLTAHGGVDAGTLARATATIGGWVGASFRRARIDASATFLMPVEGAAAEQSEVRAWMYAWSAGARGCWLPATGPRIEVSLCAGSEAGLLHATGTGALLRPVSAREPYAAAVLGLGLHYVPVRQVALVLGIDSMIPFARPGVRADDVAIHRVGPVALRARLGIEFRFR